MDILQKIVAHKKTEVAEKRNRIPVSELEKKLFFARPALSLKKFLVDPQRTGIIAEFKRKSPSKGWINEHAQVEQVTTSYAKYASGISVLTDHEFFGGELRDLESARFNQVPILRKDFIIDEYQIVEAKAHGADVILLIASCLSPKEVWQLARKAKEFGLEILLEIHHEGELEHICDEVDMVGVNNRNLKTFMVDVNTSIELIKNIPANKAAITESGISDVQTIVSLKQAGFKGFLIGENFMKHADPAIAFADFVKQLKATLPSGGRVHEN
ncbi:MAG: indole-3-glycerol phosphate synthase TrpC [Flavisolibacter sp.]